MLAACAWCDGFARLHQASHCAADMCLRSWCRWASWKLLLLCRSVGCLLLLMPVRLQVPLIMLSLLLSAPSRSATSRIPDCVGLNSPQPLTTLQEHDFAELGQEVLSHSRPSRHHPHAGSRQHRKSFQPSAVGSLDTSLTLSGGLL